MPRKPRWLLAVPDAIKQLERLTRENLTRRDLEVLFDVSKVTAAKLMKRFGAARVSQTAILPRTRLLAELRRQRKLAAFRREEERREHVVEELRKARLTGLRVTVPVETLGARLSAIPDGIVITRERIEVRYGSAKEALTRLYELARVLTNDYEEFEKLVDGGDR